MSLAESLLRPCARVSAVVGPRQYGLRIERSAGKHCLDISSSNCTPFRVWYGRRNLIEWASILSSRKSKLERGVLKHVDDELFQISRGFL